MPHQLAIDIGGTKTLAALVDGRNIDAEREIQTPREKNAGQWCDAVVDLVHDWKNDFAAAGLAVTGLIDRGEWSALNPATLPIPDRFPLERKLQSRFQVPVRAVNDAQAAAWGEYRFGAGIGRDLFYATISTGIGGGAVVNGRLVSGRNGLAGNVGQMRVGKGERIEDISAGLWIAQEGHQPSAQDVFAAALGGEGWASTILDESATMVAGLFHTIQLLLAPEIIIVGGGIGLAPGYIDRIRSRLSERPAAERPEILASVLGKHAGVIGAADLARSLIT